MGHFCLNSLAAQVPTCFLLLGSRPNSFMSSRTWLCTTTANTCDCITFTEVKFFEIPPSADTLRIFRPWHHPTRPTYANTSFISFRFWNSLACFRWFRECRFNRQKCRCQPTLPPSMDRGCRTNSNYEKRTPPTAVLEATPDSEHLCSKTNQTGRKDMFYQFANTTTSRQRGKWNDTWRTYRSFRSFILEVL